MMTEDTVRLWCSPAAKEKIVAWLIQKKCLCKRCSLAVTPEELDALSGNCKAGFGCASDVDYEMYHDDDPNHVAGHMQKAANAIWRTLLSTLPRDVTDVSEPELPEADIANGTPW